MFVHLPMGFFMARCAEGDQILGFVIAQSAPPLNMIDLKIFHPPVPLAAISIPLQDFTAEPAIRFRIQPQTRPFGTDPGQSVTWTFSRS